MTDSYVERVLINKFVELASSNLVAKCKTYYYENKDKSDEELPEFFVEQFKPEYEPGATDFEKQKEDSIRLYFGTEESTSLVEWMKLYAEYYQETESEYWTEKEDILYSEVMSIVIDVSVDKELRKTMELIDSEGNKVSIPLYSIVFENSSTERSAVSEDFTTGWYEVYFTPTAPNQIELGTDGRNRWTGFLQINICVPTNWGTSEMLYRYDEIASLFRQGLIINGVRIYRVYRGPNMTESDFTWCPVTVEWQADLDR